MEGEVRKCYDDGVVFITGGTGFLGKLLIQKLLHCTLVRKIFILVRCKKDKSEAERYTEIFEQKIFESLKEEQPDFLSRVELITGDCVLPNLGINDADWEKLKNSVNFIFHCAATVRFDQKIKTATYINVRAPMDLLRNAKEIKNLKGFVHVSTAYANCPRKDIGEVFYEPGITPRKLLALLDTLSDEQLDDFTPKLIGEWPNTYAYTKCVSEDVFRTEGIGLPLAIVRPSIVVSTYKEPIPGWIDNFYGPIGVTYAAGLGFLRTLHGQENYHADLVPVDFVINALVVAAWKVSQKTSEERQNISIYNYVSSSEKPITWKYYMDRCFEVGRTIPSPSIVYKQIFSITDNLWLHNLKLIFLHWVPAYIVDFICLCIGKERLMVDGYKKIHKFIGVIQYFTCRQWDFDNRHTQKLWEDLSSEDKKLFPFSIKTIEWEEYLTMYMVGARTYMLKEPIDTIPAGEKKMKKLILIHNVFMLVLSSVLIFFLYKFWCILH